MSYKFKYFDNVSISQFVSFSPCSLVGLITVIVSSSIVMKRQASIGELLAKKDKTAIARVTRSRMFSYSFRT